MYRQCLSQHLLAQLQSNHSALALNSNSALHIGPIFHHSCQNMGILENVTREVLTLNIFSEYTFNRLCVVKR